MDADRDAVPDDIAALKEALAVERAKALEVVAELAVARAIVQAHALRRGSVEAAARSSSPPARLRLPSRSR